MEQWQDIEGYEGMYQVSNYGRVKSLERYKENHGKLQKVDERILVQAQKEGGYMFVSLWKDGKQKMHYVHRLVVQAFIGYIPDGYTVNHLDFNPENNHVDNLEIVTQSENNNYSAQAGRYDNKGGAKIEITYNNGTVVIYDSIVEASLMIGIHRDTMMKILSGKSSGKLTFKKYNIKSISRSHDGR